MLLFLLKSLYFILPAGFANMAPIFSSKIFRGAGNDPLDSNAKLNGKPILGKHKTIRGFLSGIIFAMLIIFIQTKLYSNPFFWMVSILDYSSKKIYLIGLFMGFGALFGDSAKSFIKRRVGIKPGSKFIPWDQIDWIIGSMIFILPVYIPSWQLVLTVMCVGFFLHIAVRYVAYWLRINKEKW